MVRIQQVIREAEEKKKLLSAKSKTVLTEVSQKIFQDVDPREYDEMIFLILFEVCKMKTTLDKIDSHKLIIRDTFDNLQIMRGLC